MPEVANSTRTCDSAGDPLADVVVHAQRDGTGGAHQAEDVHRPAEVVDGDDPGSIAAR